MKGADAGFLYAETKAQPSTTVVLVRLRPGPDASGAVRPLTIDDLRAHVASRLDVLPSFRRRVERVPFGLHHPVLVDDPDFDLDHHLRHVVLDQEDEGALDRFVAARAEEVFDRRHPLWRFHLVDGLRADGIQHLVLVWSHALADGTAARTTLRRLLTDLDADELAAVRAEEPFDPQPVRRATLAKEGLGALLHSLLRLPLLIAHTAGRFKAVAEHRETAPTWVPEQGDTPVTRLNRAFTSRRRSARTTVPLAALRRVKDAAGVTVNDVLLAMAAGAVRAQLASEGGLPEAPLTVNVPVAAEPPHPPGAPARQHGNHFSNYVSSLATDVADPVERLQVISATAREGRAQLEIFGLTTMVGLLDELPPLLAEPGARWMARQKRLHADKGDYSVLLSNVRGADQPFGFTVPGGVEVEVERCSVYGTTFDGTGLTLVGWTYGEQVELTALSEAVAVPEPEAILAGMLAALDELAMVLRVEAPTGPAPASADDREEVSDAPVQR